MNARELLIAALQNDDRAERDEHLERACAGDVALRQRLDQLLQACEDFCGGAESRDGDSTPGRGEPTLNYSAPYAICDCATPLPEHDASTNVSAGEAQSPSTCSYSPPATDLHNTVVSPSSIECTAIGPYTLRQKLGEGGMGSVYLAEQTEPVRRNVALKIIKAGLSSPHVIARFEQERQALALMDHPNIAKVLDAGTIRDTGIDPTSRSSPATLHAPLGPGRPYFVMELVNGIPLTKYCDQERLTTRERLELFIPVCQAVQHAHQKGIIHRDLKPSNILVALYDGKPIPKVIDFGVAKATASAFIDRPVYTEVGQIVGTFEYMAPEQVDANNVDIDTRADIYALGVILYELLTGSTPLTTKQLRGVPFPEMLRIIREVEPPRPSTKLAHTTDLPLLAANRQVEPTRLAKLTRGDLDWIVMKCLDKDRSRRYETANGLADDLKRHLADEPVTAGAPTAGYRLRKLMKRYRRTFAAATLVFLALVFGIVGTTWQGVRARRARDDAERATASAVEERNRANDERDRANDNASIANRLNTFYQIDLLAQTSVLEQARSSVDLDPDMRLQTALDRAAAQVGERFGDEPLAEAAVRLTIGKTYRKLGQPATALSHLERAVQLFREHLGADDDATLDAMNSLAVARSLHQSDQSAEQAYRELLAESRRVRGDTHRDTLHIQVNLAHMLSATDRQPEAEQLCRSALEGLSQTIGPDDERTLLARSTLGQILTRSGRVREAEQLLRETIVAWTQVAGPDHPKTMIDVQTLALALTEQGRAAEAEPLAKSALECFARLLGPQCREALDTQCLLADIAFDLGRPAEAERLLREAIVGWTALRGPEDRATLRAENDLAAMLLRMRRPAEAEPLLRANWQAKVRVMGHEHADTLCALNNLCTALLNQNKLSEAGALVRQAHDACRRTLPPDDQYRMVSENNLANWLLFSDEIDEAIGMFRDRLERLRQKPSPRLAELEVSLHNLGWALVKAGRPADATPVLREKLDISRRMPSVSPANLAANLVDLGDVLLRAKQWTDAEQTLREARDLLANHSPATWRPFEAMSLLGGALVGQSRFDEAEPLLLEGHHGLSGLPNSAAQDRRLREARQRLIQLYDESGNKDEAEKWRNK